MQLVWGRQFLQLQNGSEQLADVAGLLFCRAQLSAEVDHVRNHLLVVETGALAV